jgi:hypothetical protein
MTVNSALEYMQGLSSLGLGHHMRGSFDDGENYSGVQLCESSVLLFPILIGNEPGSAK